jgi:hypothetical protein
VYDRVSPVFLLYIFVRIEDGFIKDGLISCEKYIQARRL